MTRILVAGATGLVGRIVLAKALADERITRVVAPTRRPLTAHAKLDNPVVDFAALPAEAEWWRVDSVISALGTTREATPDLVAYRAIDHDYPLAVARLAQRHGATGFALVSAMGANAGSRLFYPRLKGEIEQSLQALGLASLTIVRPGMIGGDRSEYRRGESTITMLLRVLHPVLPRRYRISLATIIADTLIEAAIARPPGIHFIEADRLAG